MQIIWLCHLEWTMFDLLFNLLYKDEKLSVRLSEFLLIMPITQLYMHQSKPDWWLSWYQFIFKVSTSNVLTAKHCHVKKNGRHQKSQWIKSYRGHFRDTHLSSAQCAILLKIICLIENLSIYIGGLQTPYCLLLH